ncbi:hypothetical protein BKA69DRAFT_1124827 [Paraphysoderma sedebokerense]|nr:hypothetical protein BKA69DRAFT_1124827 [Paraphysoderma sedebokerense]
MRSRRLRSELKRSLSDSSISAHLSKRFLSTPDTLHYPANSLNKTKPVPPISKSSDETNQVPIKTNGESGVLKSFIRRFEEFKSHISDLQKQLGHAQSLIVHLNDEKTRLKSELFEKSNQLAKYTHKEKTEQHITKLQDDLEHGLREERQRKVALELQVEEHRKTVEQLRQSLTEASVIVEKSTLQTKIKQEETASAQITVKRLEQIIKDKEYDYDELRVHHVKLQREYAELQEKIKAVEESKALLEITEKHLRDENTQVKQSLRELMSATKEVQDSYQSIRQCLDTQKEQMNTLTTELEESRNLYALVLSQKKQVQAELSTTIQQKQECLDKIKMLESINHKKDREVAELVIKVNETIKDYEGRLEKKDEQMWAITEKLEMVSLKQAEPPERYVEAVKQLEEQHQSKEKAYTEEIEALRATIRERESILNDHASKISDLSRKQFEPRMERLIAVENDIKERLEEYVLAEESLEVHF